MKILNVKVPLLYTTNSNIERTYTGRGDTAHTLMMGGPIGVGTPHYIERKSLAVGGGWSE